ncbi:hypothetical protein Pint_33992 [Pistacia integerrima]|uniref:Uncharacterized protein n=1 Tax=Pistacia integerrima TaxID=434235 RepID=A0ACC0X522_9ROSI|nr:hypothetical protein Pint_33992 [Pistacia integerrima]
MFAIIDAVVAAYILNATLVIPKLDKNFTLEGYQFSFIWEGGGSAICFFLLADVQLTKFDYRLSNNLDSDLQKLRCRVNYHALIFTDSILEMGKLLVERMRMKKQAFHSYALEVKFVLFCLNLICLHSLDAIMVEERKKGRNLVLQGSDGKVYT